MPPYLHPCAAGCSLNNHLFFLKSYIALMRAAPIGGSVWAAHMTRLVFRGNIHIHVSQQALWPCMWRGSLQLGADEGWYLAGSMEGRVGSCKWAVVVTRGHVLWSMEHPSGDPEGSSAGKSRLRKQCGSSLHMADMSCKDVDLRKEERPGCGLE